MVRLPRIGYSITFVHTLNKASFHSLSSYSTSWTKVHLNQQSRQMNGNGNDALSLALVGGLAKVVGLADLQALLGNKNNSSSNINSGQDGRNLDISLSQTIEQQRQASSLLPMQQQQNNTVSPSGTILGQSASIVSQAPPSSHVGTPGDNMSRFSYSTQRLEGSSATTSSGVRGNKTKRIVVVPCRARGMSIEHNFQVSISVCVPFCCCSNQNVSPISTLSKYRRHTLKFQIISSMVMV